MQARNLFVRTLPFWITLLSVNALAMTAGEHYAKQIHSTEVIEPLKDGMFGEQISPFTGATTFSVTDC